MRNKRGNLLPEETLKIILGVIVVGFLVYLLASIYFANKDAQKLDQAKGIIERVDNIVIELSALGEGNFSDIKQLEVVGWYIWSFVDSEKKPNQCINGNCFCICDKVNTLFNKDKQIIECSEEGACTTIPNLKDFEEFKIAKLSEATSIRFTNKNNLIEVSEI
jgi:hypothetical protein